MINLIKHHVYIYDIITGVLGSIIKCIKYQPEKYEIKRVS